MEANIKDLRDSFQVGYDAFERSRKEANAVWNLYHNRHYTSEQLAILERRGQPAETFNIIKLFARMLIGYYSTVVNTAVVRPENPRDVITSSVLNDAVQHVFDDNRFDIEGDQIKLGGIISGLLCAYENVQDTDKRDPFNRPIYRTELSHVPDYELVLDPMSQLDDYSDASFLHRFKWMPRDKVNKTFGPKTADKLDAYFNHLNIEEAEFTFNYGQEFTGRYRVFDNYLIVHSVVEDSDSKRWSCFWCGEELLLKEEITFRKTKWLYRVQKLHSSNQVEYYGLFRDIVESQKAMNQAVLKIQLMVNSEKAFIEEGAVEDIDEFRLAFNRVNAVIQVKDLAGVRVEQLSREILDQYTIVDQALDRIQRVLGINDSFLGMAFASDSGRKVKLQQNQTVMSLRYLTARIESFYRSLGEDVAYLIQQYYYANQILAITDSVSGQRWVELNKPMSQFTGEVGPDGQPIEEPILLPETDPANGEIMEDDNGNIIMAPIPEEETEIAFTEFTINVESSSYNDEDEKAQLMLETVMSGQIGQMMSQINPAGFLKMAALSMKSMNTKYSPNIVEVLDETANMLQQNPEQNEAMAERAAGGGAGRQPLSRGLKLPQNTNEGVA